MFALIFPSRRGVRAWAALAAVVALLALGACSRRPATAPTPAAAPPFHADNDIAMLVRSLADALAVGERIDSTDYNFEGVLTDGQGMPLYTDAQGGPGEWVVEVLNDSTAAIHNVFVGDLLPGQLREYLEEVLPMEEYETEDSDADADDELERYIYILGRACVRYEVRSAHAGNGLEGPLVRIVVSSVPVP